jgi:hypothetical protein
MTAEAHTPTCSNHPGVETRLQCSSCGTPICPRCMVSTPVGQKCPSCARQTGRARGRPRPGLIARVLGATVATGVVGGLLLGVTGLRAGLLLAALLGLVVGSVSRAAAHGRTGRAFGALAAAGLVLGAAGGILVLGVNPLVPGLLLVYVIGGAVAYVRAAGIW